MLLDEDKTVGYLRLAPQKDGRSRVELDHFAYWKMNAEGVAVLSCPPDCVGVLCWEDGKLRLHQPEE